VRLSVNVITGGRYYKAFEDDVPNDQLSDTMRKFAIADPPVAHSDDAAPTLKPPAKARKPSKE
jgi:hypothetical protein